MSQSKKVIIVGAGVAGLVAAIELENVGNSVMMLETTEK